MWTSHDLIVVAHAAVAASMVCLVALLANDVLVAERMALGASVHQPHEASEQQAARLSKRARNEPVWSPAGSETRST